MPVNLGIKLQRIVYRWKWSAVRHRWMKTLFSRLKSLPSSCSFMWIFFIQRERRKGVKRAGHAYLNWQRVGWHVISLVLIKSFTLTTHLTRCFLSRSMKMWKGSQSKDREGDRKLMDDGWGRDMRERKRHAQLSRYEMDRWIESIFPVLLPFWNWEYSE